MPKYYHAGGSLLLNVEEGIGWVMMDADPSKDDLQDFGFRHSLLVGGLRSDA